MLISIATMALAGTLAQSAPVILTPEDRHWVREMDAWVQDALDQSADTGYQTGDVWVTARIDERGRPVLRGLVKTSGCADLDAEALADLSAITSAPSAPRDLEGRVFSFQLRFRPPPEDIPGRQAFWRVQCH